MNNDQSSTNETSKLNRLPATTVKLIGSSQVITSVSSVVKELMENAFDAGATNVEVKLENHGFDKIEVRDNGSGIDASDVPYMCLRSYTSKISSFNDLVKLSTYGFRGEALSSLCAVAQLTVTTKTSRDSIAKTYTFDSSGRVLETKLSHVSNGTTVIVSGLFQNLPVRKQILTSGKKKFGEMKKIEQIVKELAIINYKTRVSLTNNKFAIWQKSAVDSPVEALVQALPTTLVKLLHELSFEDSEIRITLLVPKREGNVRNTSYSNQGESLYLFINNRPVKDKRIEKVVYEPIVQFFASAIPQSRSPTCFLSIKLPAHDLDVNLAPNKTKVIIKDLDRVTEILKELLEQYYFSTDGIDIDDIQLPVKRKKTTEESEQKQKIVKITNEVDKELAKLKKKNTQRTIEDFIEGMSRDPIPSLPTLTETQTCKLFDTDESFEIVSEDDWRSSLAVSSQVESSQATETEITLSGWSRGDIKINGKPLKGTVEIAQGPTSGSECSSQSPRKGNTGFATFAREARSEIVQQAPGTSFARIAKDISTKWKNLQDEEKEHYKELAVVERQNKQSTGPIKPKRREFCKVVKMNLSMEKIKKFISKRLSPTVEDLQVIKSLTDDLLLIRRNSTIFALSLLRLHEAINFNNSKSHLSVPAKRLSSPLRITANNHFNLWATLDTLQTSVSVPVNSDRAQTNLEISDKRLVNNGFKVVKTENDFTLIEVPDLESSPIDEFQTVIELIRSNPQIKLKNCRSAAVTDYIKSESSKAVHCSNPTTKGYSLDLYTHWLNAVKIESGTCPHLVPVQQQLFPRLGV